LQTVTRNCGSCKVVRKAFAACRADNFHWIDVYRLKRIDPLTEPETTTEGATA
jgi:hypothetical protein